jgi:hypothetical protein
MVASSPLGYLCHRHWASSAILSDTLDPVVSNVESIDSTIKSPSNTGISISVDAAGIRLIKPFPPPISKPAKLAHLSSYNQRCYHCPEHTFRKSSKAETASGYSPLISLSWLTSGLPIPPPQTHNPSSSMFCSSITRILAPPRSISRMPK